MITLWLAFAISSLVSPPGRMVKIGPTSVHVRCDGRGAPAVVLIHGFGDYSFDWALVQPAVANETEVCAYDRPGQAWSDPGPQPRGLATSAKELHELLRAARIKGPYVLVGHSWGGLIARMFAHDYPREVAGMVLVEAAHEDEYLWLNGKILRPRTTSAEDWNALLHPNVPKSPMPARAAPQRRVATKLNPPYDKLPPDAQKMRLWAMSLPWRMSGGDTDDMRADFVAIHDTTTQSDHPLGGIPLVVVSKTPGIDDDDDYTPEQRQWNRDLQDQLAALSTNSVHVIAPHSGHHVQLDEPDVVIDAIRRVVDTVRNGGRGLKTRATPGRD